MTTGRELPPRGVVTVPFTPYETVTSPDGRVEAYYFPFSSRSPLYLRDATTKRVLHTFEQSAGDALAFSADSRTIAAMHGWDDEGHLIHELTLWDVSTGETKRIFKLDEEAGEGAYLHSVAFSHDGTKLAAGVTKDDYQSGKILVWDLNSAAKPGQFDSNAYPVNAVACSRDGKAIVSAGNDKLVNFWDTTTGVVRGALKAHPTAVEDLSFEPDNKTLLSCGGPVMFWDAVAAAVAPRFAPNLRDQEPLDYTQRAALSPDGELLATADSLVVDGNGNPTHSLSGARTDSYVSVRKVATGELLFSAQTASGTHAFNDVIAFSPDGRKLASAGYVVSNPPGERPPVDKVTPVVRIFDIASRKEEHVLRGHESLVTALAFSADGKTLASGELKDDHAVMLWDMANLGRPRVLTRAASVMALVFNRSGSLLVSGGWDNKVVVWNLRTGRARPPLVHSSKVNAVAFSADERVILSGGDDKRVKLWDAATGKELASVITLGGAGGRGDWLVVTPEGCSTARRAPGSRRSGASRTRPSTCCRSKPSTTTSSTPACWPNSSRASGHGRGRALTSTASTDANQP